MDHRQVVDVLQRSHTTRVVRKVSVRRCYVKERKRKIWIGEWRRETEEELADAKYSLIGHGGRRRPTPVHRKILRRAYGVYEIWGSREDWTTGIGRVTKRVL